MQFVNMGDSVSADALPTGLHAYAGYVDGAWPSFAPICRRFAHEAHCVSITVLGGQARFADCERNDLDPKHGAAWLIDRVPVEQGGLWTPESPRTRGIDHVWRPGLYFPVSWLTGLKAALRKLAPELVRAAYCLWGARWQRSVPTEMPADLDALQWWSPANATYDLSICRGAMFNPPVGNSVRTA